MISLSFAILHDFYLQNVFVLCVNVHFPSPLRPRSQFKCVCCFNALFSLLLYTIYLFIYPHIYGIECECVSGCYVCVLWPFSRYAQGYKIYLLAICCCCWRWRCFLFGTNHFISHCIAHPPEPQTISTSTFKCIS